MPVVETLRYYYSTEILSNLPSYYRHPDHVLQLSGTSTCPYCGTGSRKPSSLMPSQSPSTSPRRKSISSKV
jgi:hypothetical protein